MKALRNSFTAALAAVLLAGGARAATLESAEVTRVFNMVDLLPPNAGATPAEIGDEVSGQTAVQTGSKSRAELQFNDETVARLGANSVFTFEKGTRDLDLKEGVILLQVPKDVGGATVNTAAVSAAVTGTTVMVESRKAFGAAKGIVKFIVLEGTMRLFLKGRLGESILLGAGQMLSVAPNARRLPEPVYVDLAKLTSTSGLMSGEFSKLRNEPFITQAITQQQILKSRGKLLNLNYALYGKKKNPVLATTQINNTAGLRTDAEIPRSKKQTPVPEPRALQQRIVNPPSDPNPPKPPPKPPKPPKPDCNPPKPPKPPHSKPQPPPPQPPPVPPAPEIAR